MLGRFRIASGLILFAYVTTHLFNHGLGIVSLAAMERGLGVAEFVWRGVFGTIALYGALVTHIGTVLLSLFRRRDLRLGAREAVQIVLGLAIPLLLAEHFAGTRAVHEVHGIEDSYTYVLLDVWVLDRTGSVLQVALLVVAWGHGCLGLHAWLRLKPRFTRWAPYLYAAAIAIPLLALVGFLDGAREVARRAADPAWLEAALTAANLPDDAALAFFGRVTNGLLVLTVALVALVIAGREARRLWEHQRGLVVLSYPGAR